MAEATLSIPKYRRHQSGQARVTFPGPRPRHSVYLGKFGSTESKAAYQRVIQEWLARGRPGRRSTGERLLVDVIDTYQRHAQDYYRDAPKEREKIRLSLQPLKELYAATPANQFGPLALKGVRQQLIGRGLARRTINMRVAIIKRMFKWAVEQELVSASVWHALQAVPSLRQGKSGARETAPIKPVPDEIVDATLARLQRRIRAMIQVQRLCGCRSGEITRLRGMDVDRTGPVWIYRPPKHKNAHRAQPREIYFGPKAQAILHEFLQSDPQAFWFSPQQAQLERYRALREARKSRVQPSQMRRRKRQPRRQPGACYPVRSYRQAIVRACRKAGLPHWHPHQLRHSAGTYLRKEFGVELARIILGHRSLAATEIYSEMNRQQAMTVVARIG